MSDTRKPVVPLEKPESEWQKILEPERFGVLFHEDTEPAWTSALNEVKREGTFICAACFLPLFDSSGKFDSGTGWPSFFKPIDPARMPRSGTSATSSPAPSITVRAAVAITAMCSATVRSRPANATAITASRSSLCRVERLCRNCASSELLGLQ